jgi:ferredoxin
MIRRIVQLCFLVFILSAVFLVKGNVERWCPFGGIETLYTYYTQGNLICSLAISNLYILVGLLLVTLLVRRAFCGYICPIGTISEWLGLIASRLGIKTIHIPYRLDRSVALLKYIVLGLILFFTWHAGELYFRTADPCYALISRHGEDITHWAYVVAGAILGLSLFLTIPFCRWFCPMAAVFNLFSRFGLTRVKRDVHTCVGCGKCARVCPMAIPVDKVEQVTSARCLSCLNCVEACPHAKKGALTWGPSQVIGKPWPRVAVIGVLLMGVALAVSASYAFPLPSFFQSRGTVSGATQVVHLKVKNLTCRGKASLFVYFLEREDELEIPGYLKIEAWPGPGLVDARITFDPSKTDEDEIRQAITEPYYDSTNSLWRSSPFEIEGYDPLESP